MTRRGQMPSGGSAVDLDRSRRKLPSLQKQIEDYSRRAWFTIPSARGNHGVDANAPREPVTLGIPIRLAARVVDTLTGGHARNIGRCTCDPCDCSLSYADGSHKPCHHDEACPHTGIDEDPEKLSARLRALVAFHNRKLARAVMRDVEEVYQLAGLTPAEARVAHYKHEGLSYTSIAFLIDRKEGTVKALYSRATFKLEQLAEPIEVAA